MTEHEHPTKNTLEKKLEQNEVAEKAYAIYLKEASPQGLKSNPKNDLSKSNWMREAKNNLKSLKPRCSCWKWCPGKLVGCSPTVSQDRDRGVVTLGGHTTAGAERPVKQARN